MRPRLLFQAPIDFDLDVVDDYLDYFDMVSSDYDVIVCNPKANFIYDDKLLSFYPNLKILATPSTGTNHIDMDACKRRGIKVVSLLDDRKGLDTITASSEFTFKLILDALRIAPARELIGKVVGLVGYGRIGKNVERYCRAFGARVRYIYDPYVGCYDSLEWVFQYSDIVVICCSLTDETRGIIGRKLLRTMKEGAVLVNTARGEVIREYELAEVMKDRQDLRVALDVLVGETTGMQNPAPLLALGAIITPHIAGETFDSRTKAAKIILRLLKGMI